MDTMQSNDAAFDSRMNTPDAPSKPTTHLQTLQARLNSFVERGMCLDHLYTRIKQYYRELPDEIRQSSKVPALSRALCETELQPDSKSKIPSALEGMRRTSHSVQNNIDKLEFGDAAFTLQISLSDLENTEIDVGQLQHAVVAHMQVWPQFVEAQYQLSAIRAKVKAFEASILTSKQKYDQLHAPVRDSSISGVWTKTVCDAALGESPDPPLETMLLLISCVLDRGDQAAARLGMTGMLEAVEEAVDYATKMEKGIRELQWAVNANYEVQGLVEELVC